MNKAVPPVDSLLSAVQLIREGQLPGFLQRLVSEGNTPGTVESLNLLGEGCSVLGLRAQAVDLHMKALDLDPANCRTLCAAGEALEAEGRFLEAKACFSKALEIDGGFGPAWSGLGYLGLQTGDIVLANTSLERARLSEPENPDILNRFGLARLADKRFEEAIESFLACISARSNYAPFWNNLASAYRASGLLQPAANACRRALEIRPDDASTWTSLGVLFQETNAIGEALKCYEKALCIDPSLALARTNLGVLLLLTGAFERGWIHYEYRWLTNQCPAMRYPGRPVWRGELPLEGKVVLLHADQGFGDTLQFLRYAKVLQERGACIHVEVQKPLLELAQNVPGVSRAFEINDGEKSFDFHCPFLSVPLGCGTTLHNIPTPIPYVRASQAAVHKWAAQDLGLTAIETSPRPRVAFCWRGNPKHQNDHNRSLTLDPFRPLFEEHPCLFVNVQLNPTKAECEILRAYPHIVDPTPHILSFDDTAALLQLVDVVITVDSAVAHLSGAMGKPVWVLLPFAPDWRWMLDRTDSPWYPTARLFRQNRLGDWTGPFGEISSQLKALTSAS
jgi:tetratricopeptide (TPR) repeat protein